MSEWTTALHEAGHWTVAEALGITVQMVTIEPKPDSRVLGWNALLFDLEAMALVPGDVPLIGTAWHSRQQAEARICTLLAGDLAVRWLAPDGYATEEPACQEAARREAESAPVVASVSPAPDEHPADEIDDGMAALDLAIESSSPRIAGLLLQMMSLVTDEIVATHASLIEARARLLLRQRTIRLAEPILGVTAPRAAAVLAQRPGLVRARLRRL